MYELKIHLYSEQFLTSFAPLSGVVNCLADQVSVGGGWCIDGFAAATACINIIIDANLCQQQIHEKGKGLAIRLIAPQPVVYPEFRNRGWKGSGGEGVVTCPKCFNILCRNNAFCV